MPGSRQVITSLRERLSRVALPMLGTHWLAALLLAGGLVLRVLTLAAYHPALLYTDTLKYLYGAWSGADPLGYAVILKAILEVGDLGTVAVVQHLLGLAMAATIYALLCRRGVPRWLGAVAIAPVLFDAYQLQIESLIMPDVWFEAFIVAGLALVLWRREPSLRVVAGCGLILGLSATIRQVGLILALPVLLYVVVAATGRRQALRGAVALLATFAIPVVGYASIALVQTGHFQLSDEGSIAGRLAVSADCKTLALPAAERPLCPTPTQQARGIDWIEHSTKSPLKRVTVPAGSSRGVLLSGFDHAVEKQQPLRVVLGVLGDSLKLFAPEKTALPGVTPISRWQFQAHYPRYLPEINVGRSGRIILGVQVTTRHPFSFRPLDPAYGGRAQVDRPIARFLRSYQLGGGYTPGPLLALLALAALIGSVIGLGRRLGTVADSGSVASSGTVAPAGLIACRRSPRQGWRACVSSRPPSACSWSLTCTNSPGATSCPRWSPCRRPASSAPGHYGAPSPGVRPSRPAVSPRRTRSYGSWSPSRLRQRPSATRMVHRRN